MIGGERGQAAIELLAALPVALVILLAGWQVVLAGHAWWTLSESARIAARAAYVAPGTGAGGRERAARLAVARVLPGALKRDLRTRVSSRSAVRVSARVPLVAPLAEAFGRDGGPLISVRSELGR